MPQTARPRVGSAGGDPDVLGELYAVHGAACLSVARCLLVDPQLAEDAVQAAFVQLMRGPVPPGRSSTSSGRQLLTLTRRAARERLRTAHGPGDQPEAADPAARLGEPARAMLRELAPETHQAFILSFLGGRTSAEIALILGVRADTVRTHLFDAMVHLTGATARLRAASAELP